MNIKGSKIIASALAALVLSACGGGSGGISISHSSYDSGYAVADEPALIRASVYDSFGDQSSIDDNFVAEIDPYLDYGLFEVNWQVDAIDDYYVEIAFGHSLFYDSATVVHAEYCGPYESCDLQGVSLCEYTTDYAMRCDSGLAFSDLRPHIFQLPQNGYFFVSVCSTDLNYCEYDTIRARLF